SFDRSATGCARLTTIIVLPMAGALESVGNFLRHIGLVMFGENRIGFERAASIEYAFGHHTLTFAEQIWQRALVTDRNDGLAVGDFEPHAKISASHHAPVFHQTAEPDTRTGPDMFLHNVRR